MNMRQDPAAAAELFRADAPVVWVCSHVAGRLETPLAPDIPVAHWAWALLAAVPIATSLIAMFTARITALRELAKMP